jgi:hypothetical protein
MVKVGRFCALEGCYEWQVLTGPFLKNLNLEREGET